MTLAVCLRPAQFPSGVRDLPEPPSELFLTGQIPPGPRIALVGTRRPTPEALKFTEQLALELSQAGVVVVSGGAAGIDTAAHEGALRAGKGTLVVAPSSYVHPYPEDNRELFQRIVEASGGHLTLAGQAVKAQRHAFFARNALLVSLCSAVVLVQAPHRSGARNATLWARKLRRTVWVVPHPPWCYAGASSASELRLGGRPLTSCRDITRWLASRGEHAIPGPRPSHGALVEPTLVAPAAGRAKRAGEGLARDATPAGEPSKGADPHRDVCRLVAALRLGPKHPDELCVALGWPAARLQSTVLHATLMGEAARLPTGQVSLSADRG